MTEFFSALMDPDSTFLRYAFVLGILSSIAFGMMGTYVVARRISYMAASISHCLLGGIGIALYLQIEMELTWVDPMFGAVAAGLVTALIIGLVSLYGKERDDTVIGAVWVIGMAVGLLFIAKTRGYIDPMSYLFGNILFIEKNDLWLVLGLDILVIVLGILFYNKFLAVCFDEEFARLRGVKVEFYYLLLLFLTALTVVLLVKVVGIVMVVALLTLPAAVAGVFSKRLWQMMVLSVIFCIVFVSVGIGVSYVYDLPTGPIIILFAGMASTLL